jgi:predicted RNA-binding protein with PUA-like domain
MPKSPAPAPDATSWMVKSEPASYSWDQFVKDGGTAWTGVRNYQARINLRAMKKGDSVFFYHSVTEKAVVGIARVTKIAYPDATAQEGEWVCVDLAPTKPLARAVTLEEMKENPKLQELPLLRHTRLSVLPVRAAEFEEILKLAKS